MRGRRRRHRRHHRRRQSPMTKSHRKTATSMCKRGVSKSGGGYTVQKMPTAAIARSLLPTDRMSRRRASAHGLGDGLAGLPSGAPRSGCDSGRAVRLDELERTNGVVLCGAARVESSLDAWKAGIGSVMRCGAPSAVERNSWAIVFGRQQVDSTKPKGSCRSRECQVLLMCIGPS